MDTLNLQVGASYDDVLRIPSEGAGWYPTHTQLGVGYVGPTQPDWGNGFRFTNITIPKDAIITAAHLHVTAQEDRAEVTVKSYISAEAADDPATFANDKAAFDARYATHGTPVAWDSIAAWTLDTEYQSVEIKDVIQAIVNRAGWVSGNDIVIFWEDFDKRSDQESGHCRIVYSWDNDTAKAAKLHIEYTVGTYKDITSRFKLTVQTFQDVASRFKLIAQAYQDITSRFVLTASTFIDITSRFRLFAQTYQDITSRFVLTFSLAYQDITSRFKLIATAYQDVVSRFKVAILTYKDIASRFKIFGQSYKDITSRFKLFSPSTYKDITSRFVLTPAQPILDGSYRKPALKVSRVLLTSPYYASKTTSESGVSFGERLRSIQSKLIVNRDDATRFVVASLAKSRFESNLGQIFILPNCGQERYDVIRVYDTYGEGNTTFRVAGIVDDLNWQTAEFQETLLLTEV